MFIVGLRRGVVFFDDKKRIDLEDVAEAIPCDQCNRNCLVHTGIEGLNGHGASTLQPVHHEGYQLSHRRLLGHAHCCVKVFRFDIYGVDVVGVGVVESD